MDFLLSFPTMFIGFSLLFSLVWISRSLLKRSFSNTKRPAPEAGGAWPVIGHLHLLGGSKPTHITLGNMADKYGPIFTIRLGVHRVLVVSSSEMAEECLTTNDRAFANRPRTLATEVLGFNFTIIGFSPYGPYWRHARKIATLELLSNHRLEKLKHVRESEVKESLKELYQLWLKNKNSSNQLFMEMKKWFNDVTLNVILRKVVGKRMTTSSDQDKESSRWRKALTDFFELSGRFMLSDALPFLRPLDIGGHEKFMRKTAKELNHIAEECLEEHKRKRLSGGTKEAEDFMDVMLSILHDSNEFPSHDADAINKAICLTLLLAASDTTTVTLTRALSLLLNNPDALKKAQDELDNNVGREKQVKSSETNSLVYLQAILKETMRLYPAAPLSVVHESTEDCTVGGYHVPAGTRLQVNLAKIHRDPRVWSAPCEFQPERFLHKDVDVRGQNFELIPFGSGRRMCPGISFALEVMQLTLASLLHGFDFATSGDEPIDMQEGVRLTSPKATPLEVFLTPRLPGHLYC